MNLNEFDIDVLKMAGGFKPWPENAAWINATVESLRGMGYLNWRNTPTDKGWDYLHDID